MALILMDGCGDDGLHNSTYNKFGGSSIYSTELSTSYGRLGGVGARVGDSANDYIRPYFTMSGDTIVIGFALYVNNVGASTNEILLWGADGGSFQWVFRLDANGTLWFDDSNGTTRQAESAAGAVPIKSWCHIEFKVKHHATAGTVDVRVNGISIISATSLDTIGTANTYIDSFGITQTSGGYVHDVYVDDLYVLDGSGSAPYNDFLGDVKVEVIYPDGNGNSSGMTGSDGNSVNNFELVDENPVVTTDYVEGSTEGNKDTYAMDNLGAGTSDSVYGVQVSLVQQKDDTGTKYLRPVIRRGSTDYVGTSVSLTTSWTCSTEIWEQDPSTSLDWTVTNINGMEVGQEVRDS